MLSPIHPDQIKILDQPWPKGSLRSKRVESKYLKYTELELAWEVLASEFLEITCEPKDGVLRSAHKVIQQAHLIHLESGDSEPLDVIERALYNSLLEATLRDPEDQDSSGFRELVISQDSDTILINLLVGFEANLVIKGVAVRLRAESGYPWKDEFILHIDPESAVEFEIGLRIPEWADETEIELKPVPAESEYEGGYARVRRVWNKGDEIRFEPQMVVQFMSAHPRFSSCAGRVCVQRGPLIYCHQRPIDDLSPNLFAVDPLIEPELVEEPDRLGGVTSILVHGTCEVPGDEAPYAPYGTHFVKPARAKLIPYYYFGREGAVEVQVWMRVATQFPEVS